MLEKYIFDNPELIRNIRTSFRYPRYASFTALYFLMLFSIYFLIYLSNNKITFSEYNKVIYTVTLGIEYLAYFYLGSYLISNSLSQEKEKGTFDFLRMTIIDRKVITTGKLIGAPIFISFIIGLTFPLIILEAYIGKVSLINFIMSHFNLLIYGLLFHTIALFSAMTIRKSSSANGLSIAMPMFLVFFSLALQSRTANPFYSLFSGLLSKAYVIHKINFFGINLPDFLLIGILISYIVYWLTKGLVRKFESETNHILNKTQSLISLLGTELLILGLFWDKLISGQTSAINAFFVINFILMVLYIGILSPNKDDIIIEMNQEDKREKSMFKSRGPIFSLVILFNLIFTGFGLSGNIINYLGANVSLKNMLFTLTLGVITAFFSMIYTQVFYLSNITLNKHSTLFTTLVLAISLFIPLPVNYLTSSKDNLLSLFLLNPFIVITRLDKFDYFNLATITELIILLIIILLLNVIILSKNEEMSKKYKINS